MILMKPFHCHFQNTTRKFLQIYFNKTAIKERDKNYGCQNVYFLIDTQCTIAEKNVIAKRKNKIGRLQEKQSYDRL